jgi:hypothetical protein
MCTTCFDIQRNFAFVSCEVKTEFLILFRLIWDFEELDQIGELWIQMVSLL